MQMCFPMKFEKIFRRSVLKNICKWLLLEDLNDKFNSTLDNFNKNCISLAVLRIEGLIQGAPQKELINAPFLERFKATSL